jgi:hypothetical protein
MSNGDCLYTVCVGDDPLQLRFLSGMLTTLRTVAGFDGAVYVVCDMPMASEIARGHGATAVEITSPDHGWSFDDICRVRLEADSAYGVPLARYDTVTHCDCDVVWLREWRRWADQVPSDRPLCVQEVHDVFDNKMADYGWPEPMRELAKKMRLKTVCTGLIAWPGRRTACTLERWRAAYRALPHSDGREQSAFNLLVVHGDVHPAYVLRGTVLSLSERHKWDPWRDSVERSLRPAVVAHISGYCEQKGAVERIWEAALELSIMRRPEILEALL